jgi:hypothetical protein
MTALTKPTTTEHNSVNNWMKAQQPLQAPDARFILEKEDLVTLRPGREYAWLDAAIETVLRSLRIRPIEVSVSPAPGKGRIKIYATVDPFFTCTSRTSSAPGPLASR